VTDGDNFAHLGSPRRIWAVAACSGAADRIERIHQAIAERFVVGDRLIYLGNYLGGVGSATTIDHLLAFRAYLLAMPGMIASDIVYLRGAQEEIWSKLLQLQFAPNPRQVLTWMLARGAGETIAAYGGDAEEGMLAAREGAMALTKWTNRLREAIRRRSGHDTFMSVLRRAALTGRNGSGHLLFVHAGLDPSRPLGAQRDSFWWEAGGFSRIAEPFESFARIFRGADPAGHGPVLTGYTVTLDGGCGRGGKLLAAGIAPGGEIIDLIEA
jgi:hypothetical protein